MVSTTTFSSPQPHHTQQSSSPKKTAAPSIVRPASPLLASPFKRKTMSITQTYYLAHKARAKLSAEAQRPDHDLRKLVGSANLLDALMLDLADAEREQESWFNQSVRGATKSRSSTTAAQQDRRVQWADAVVEEPEEDWEAEDASSDSDSDDSDYYEEEDVEMADVIPLTRIPSAAHAGATASQQQQQEDDFLDEDDYEDDYAELSLTRSTSHSATSPPELALDSDESDDESMPPSPPTASLPSFSEKQQQRAQRDSEPRSADSGFYEQGYYLPPRNPARLISAISVY